MPWQQYVADVATERVPDPVRCPACAGAPGGHRCPYAYQVVVVSVPRQSGKTLLLMVMQLVRCIQQDNHQSLYTAQTGKDARERWKDLVKLVTGSPIRSFGRPMRSQGSERLEFPNGSMLGVFAPTPESLHGYTPPTVVVDEAFAQSQDEGDALEAAIEPAQQTLPHRQLWLVSTRGTADSTWFHGWVERAKAGTPGVALFDWGASDDHDPRDSADLVAFHPALGLPDGLGNGITPEGILGSNMKPSEYERAYGNRETVTESHVISPQEWAALGGVQTQPGDAPLVLTYDVAYDRSAATIGATWTDADGVLQHKLVRWQPGVSWVAPQVMDLCQRWGRRVVAVASDDTGPAREVTDQLQRMSSQAPPVCRDPTVLTTREVTVAWGELLAAVKTGPGSFGHDADGHLSDAAAAVVPRPVLDSAAPSRRYSPGDISPLIALMVGLYVAKHTQPEEQTPMVAFA